MKNAATMSQIVALPNPESASAADSERVSIASEMPMIHRYGGQRLQDQTISPNPRLLVSPIRH
jgi:hypothetical protein